MNLVKHALRAAALSPLHYKVGAAVLRGKSVLWGHNSLVTHPRQAAFARNEFSIYLHAEIAAMIKAEWQADALVVVRLRADGSWGCAKPCDGCVRALTNVGAVWYSTGVGEALARL